MFYFFDRLSWPGTQGSAGTVPVERGTGGYGGAVGLAGQDLRHQDGAAQSEHDAQGHGDDQADHGAPSSDLVYWRVTTAVLVGQGREDITGSRPDIGADQ